MNRMPTHLSNYEWAGISMNVHQMCAFTSLVFSHKKNDERRTILLVNQKDECADG